MGEMLYSEFVSLYDALFATTKRLEKEKILAEFLKKLAAKENYEWIYLLRGRVFADYDSREFGMSEQLSIKAISSAFGIRDEEVHEKFKKIGDLGEIAEFFAEKKKQSTLFSSKLAVRKVFENLRKIADVEGKGAVRRKIELVSELLSGATGKEAKYVFRTLLSDLRVGIADGIVRDAIATAFFSSEKNDNEKNALAERVEMSEKIGKAYDLSGDFARVLEAAVKGKKEVAKIKITVGRPVQVMLSTKVETIEEAFEECGKPAAIELKYDGFRMVISKKGKEIKLFTRRLEEVTKQFPDVVSAVRENVKGDEFLLDAEAVGFDFKTKKYLPFEAISQRIKRKYEIEKMEKELPVEVNVFDVLVFDGDSTMDLPFHERRKLLEKIVKEKKYVLRLSEQIVTDDEKVAMGFFHSALKMGEEGIMIKNIGASYQQGRRVGFMVKLKPVVNDLDLVIVGAEYGSGKRGGWLTSYIVACLSDGKYLELGKVSSGLKELESEDYSDGETTYDAMTKLLKPLIISESGKEVRVQPKVVVSVTYQNIQKSQSYDSGYALRFPRITRYRPDKSVKEIATLGEIEKEAKKGERK